MKFTLLLLTLIAATVNNTALANNNLPSPFAIKNQNPFIQIFGLPTTQPATLLPANNNAIEVAFNTANNSIINKIAADALKVIRQPEVRDKIAAAGFRPTGLGPDEFQAYMKSEIQRWRSIIRTAKITAE